MWRDSLRQKRNGKLTSVRRKVWGDPALTRAKRTARIAKLSFFTLLALIILGFVGFQIFAFTLPSPEKIVRHEGFSTKILDRNGKLLYDIFVDKKRTQVPLSEIPQYLREATIAIEDRNFYSHQGFDPTGYLRIAWNLVTKRRLIGGSTLTQQLVKNVLLTPERTAVRKVKELVLTLQIEQRYSKDEILALYLNEVPYGGTAWGVESASETYFGKKVSELGLLESAILAGFPQLPSLYSPYSQTPKAYIGRTTAVLRRMREDGYITVEQEEASLKELPDFKFQPKGGGLKAPHFVQYVQDILNTRYGEKAVEQGGLQVTTTLDLDLQVKAQKIVADEIAKVEKVHITNGASVTLDSQTGEILAMVGSKDFLSKDYDGQVNVTTSLRQPGSSFKPFTYLTGFKKGYTASTLLVDAPTKFPGGVNLPDYEPVSYDGKYRGPVQVRYALGNSLNIPAVKMLALVGIRNVLETATDLGITSLPPTDETLRRVGLSLTLGGGEVKLIELTGAYGAFMNGGYKVAPLAILKVVDKDGSVLEEIKPSRGPQVIKPEEAFLVNNILSDNGARLDTFGPNSLLNIPGRKVAVKTGTTNDKRDNWTIGGTPQITVGVWVGNNDNSPMKEVASGVSGASPIWNQTLKAALEGKPAIDFDSPPNIQSLLVDKISGFREHDALPSRQEFFIKGTEPGEDKVHLLLKVCKGDTRLATPSDIAAQNFELKEFIDLKENDPTASSGGENRWQTGVNAWIELQPENNKYKPPTSYCSGVNNAPLNIEFIDPRDRVSDLPQNFNISFLVDAISDVSEVRLEIDGIMVKSYSSDQSKYEYSASLDKGKHTLRAWAKDKEGRESERIIDIGVETSWQ